MGFVSALTTLGVKPIVARHLGFDPATALTATGNNSQSGAYQLTANFNQFTVVTSTNNSAKLPQAVGSANGIIIVRNDDSADDLNVFPYSGDSINALAADTAVIVSAGTNTAFFRVSNTLWLSLKQPSTIIPDNIGALSNGVVVKTGSTSFASRTIIGTSGNIAVTNGDGVSGNPTIDFDTTFISGWIQAPGTWTYASSTTITTSYNATLYHVVGDKLRCVNGSTIYLYVTAVSASTLTVTGGSDYSLTNTAITAPVYSKNLNPVGHPVYFNYIPTITPGGSMTLTGTSVIYRFCMKGPQVSADFVISGTIGAPLSNIFDVTVPVSINSGFDFAMATKMSQGGVNEIGITYKNNSTTCRIGRNGFPNFGAGACELRGDFSYQPA